jgi:hypothetical protein
MKQVYLVFLAVLCVSISVHAQGVNTGAFTGTVKDTSGGVIPGVTITIINTGTSIGRTATTNGQGIYNVGGLQAGVYDIKVEYSGFATQVKKNVTLTVGGILTMDLTLAVSGGTEVVEVGAVAPMIETTQSEVHGTIQTKELENLPILNRNFSGLLMLMPGVRPANPWDPTKRTIGGLSIGGSTGRNLNATIDGGDSRDSQVGGLLQNFTTEGIQEFKVAMHRFSAAEGRSAGAILTIVTKSGTNEFHGSAFLFARDTVFQAKDYFSKRDNLPIAPLSRQQFGGSVGGPVIKDRAFFFGAVERIRQDTSMTIPDNAYNQLLLLVPYGAAPVHQIPQPYGETMYTIKGDFKISDTDTLSVRWAQQLNNATNDQITTPIYDLSVSNHDKNRLYSILASETKSIGSNKVNQFTFQFNNFLGDLYSNILPPATGSLTFPSVAIGGSVATGQVNQQQRVQFRDDFSTLVGRHTLRFGGDYGYYLKLGAIFTYPQGTFVFFDDPSVITSDKTRYPQGFATPGAAQSFSQTTTHPGYSVAGTQAISGYFQDDWKVSNRLTLNLGIRYDVSVNFFGFQDMPHNLTYLALKAIGNPYGTRTPSSDKSNLGPRVGFAFDPSGKGDLVIRAGYGLYYDPGFLNQAWPALSQAQGTPQITVTSTNTAVGVGQMATYRLGIDPLPAPPPAPNLLPKGGQTNGFILDPDLRNPYSQQASAGFGFRFRGNYVLDADYTHVQGVHEYRFYAINMLSNGVRALGAQFDAALGDPKLLGWIRIAESSNRSRYDEFAVKLERRGKRMSFQGSYTLSKAYGFAGDVVGSISVAQDQNNMFAPGEWGPSGNDSRHRVMVSGIFQLPLGIQLSPVMQAETARPYTLTAGTDLNKDGNNNDRYVDPATGQQVAVRSARGDPFFLTDLRATKFFRFKRERLQLSVFAEFFNLFNTVNFGNTYQGNSRSPTFKQPIGFMPGIGTGSPFQTQFGMRFSF